MTTTPPWETTIDPGLAQRLWRPVAQPGAIDGQMGDRILTRHYQFLNPAPLLDRCLQRQIHHPMGLGEVPIVYAQPSAISSAPGSDLQNSPSEDNRPPIHPPTHPPIHPSTLIQAKLDPAAPRPLPLADPSTAATAESVIPRPDRTARMHPGDSLDPSAPRHSTPAPPLVIQAKLGPAASPGVIPPPLTPSPLPVVRPSIIRTAAPAPLAADLRSPSQDEIAALPARSTTSLPLPLVVPLTPVPVLAPSDRPVVRPRRVDEIAPKALSNPAPAFSLPLVSSPKTGVPPASAGSPGNPGDRQMGLPIVPGQTLPPQGLRPEPHSDSYLPRPPALDLNQLADQVERRLTRKLTVERERRGWTP